VTSIEWTNKTWNPVTGCTKVSPGCDHCYAENIARRFAGGKAFPNGFAVTLHPERLFTPTTWRKPSFVFVNSMSDLFHDDVPDSFIAQIFAVMADTPQHTYQILTKRHGRMRSLIGDAFDGGQRLIQAAPDEATALSLTDTPWPLPNLWLGVSAEDQERAALRIPSLLETRAAVRFVSAEPLLGPIDLTRLARRNVLLDALGGDVADAADGAVFTGTPSVLDWVIVGGESGNGARPMELGWAEQLVEQCAAAGTAVFVKQLGSAWARSHGYCTSPKGGEIRHWPEQLRVRQMPDDAAATAHR
jgi:protein gp37